MRLWISESFKPCFIHSATFFRCASSRFILCPAQLWRLLPRAQLFFRFILPGNGRAIQPKTFSPLFHNPPVDQYRTQATDPPRRKTRLSPEDGPENSSNSRPLIFPAAGMPARARTPDADDGHLVAAGRCIGDGWR